MPRTPKDVSTQVEIDLLAQLNLIPAETFGSLIGLNADSERVMQSRGTLPPCIKIASRRYYKRDAVDQYFSAAAINVDNTHRVALGKQQWAKQENGLRTEQSKT